MHGNMNEEAEMRGLTCSLITAHLVSDCCSYRHSCPLLSGPGAPCVLQLLIRLMPGFTPHYSKLLLTHAYVTWCVCASDKEMVAWTELYFLILVH